ncbi:MAG: hypothetical protein JSU92_14805 [Deltaproteobacteria bacterium]|nr:MAG: hypothetical protein JSU92_14805 [Deltaproteobacteria bacterium]
MIIIWVRHGRVDKKSRGADLLKKSGLDFANRLPDILEKAGFHPQMVFIDISKKKNGQSIERCEKTVAKLFERFGPPLRYDYTNKDGRIIIDKCNDYDTALICYTSESLKYFPKIKGAICEDYMGNPHCQKAPREITDRLYENIIISEYNGNEIRQIATIETGELQKRVTH